MPRKLALFVTLILGLHTLRMGIIVLVQSISGENHAREWLRKVERQPDRSESEERETEMY